MRPIVIFDRKMTDAIVRGSKYRKLDIEQAKAALVALHLAGYAVVRSTTFKRLRAAARAAHARAA
jgi:hypothetical protein